MAEKHNYLMDILAIMFIFICNVLTIYIIGGEGEWLNIFLKGIPKVVKVSEN